MVVTSPGRAPTHALLFPSPPPPSANVSQVQLRQLRHVPVHKDPKPYLSLLPISSTTRPFSPYFWTEAGAAHQGAEHPPGGTRLWQVTSLCSRQGIPSREGAASMAVAQGWMHTSTFP